MAHLYNYPSSSCPQEPDDISVFLHQILLRSSSSSSSSFTRHHSVAALPDHLLTENQDHPAIPVPGPGQIHAPDPCSGVLKSSSGCSFTTRAVANVSSSSVGNLDNEPDEYDYESEEGVEAMAEEMVRKPTPGRSSSKRSRAAEVHNLSEKRRRSRINEKMKALQNLIPNSNKTDKASMLDEAIEYLKQLQLQVQMLTMRNGLSLYPICLPEMLPPNQISQPRMEIYDTDKFLTTNVSKSIPIDQNISPNELLRLQDNCVKHTPLADFSTMIGSKTLYKVESSEKDHIESLELSRSSREKMLPCRSLNEDCPPISLTGTKATSSIPFETRASHFKDSALEACVAGGGDHLLANFVNNPIFSSQLNM